MTGITGPFVAIVTPFDGDEGVNAAALRRQVDRQASAGNGVFCAGTNGEFYALSSEEKLRVAETCVEAADGRVPVLADIGKISTHQTVALGKAVGRLGVKAVSAITPYFIACSQAELADHYRRVADALPVPLYLYNIPARTGNTLEPETARALAEHPNIIGVKDSAGSQESLDGYLAVARDQLRFRRAGRTGLAGAAWAAPGSGGLHLRPGEPLPGDAQRHPRRLCRGRSGCCGNPAGPLQRPAQGTLRAGLPAGDGQARAVPCHARVGRSRAPALVAEGVDRQIREISARYAEAV